MPSPKRILPKPGQESVWDYPRPPRLEYVGKRIEIVFAGLRIVDAPHCHRVLETSHPPVYYISPDFIAPGALEPATGSSVCEWKGRAAYFDVIAKSKRADKAAWTYPEPTSAFAAIANHVAFYAGPMDSCTIDGVVVTPQPGGFYGGWITPDIVGPFKGIEGSMGW
ncbi:hypothetical protein VW35_02965 [Devosia soli]|uniref:DUF427 domain-containing protein n=1 Tax=Devosia soli TaxID=361041 RepID=A0A0F5LFR4_9HYPH|nr:DUF427 domain-containing protein [Devosia soli]KKB81135.1 hypothetical protein VW35_02965 [Devosia soli]